MNYYIHCILISSLFLALSVCCNAQSELPAISPTATYTTSDGSTEETESMSGSAPIVGVFRANPSFTDGWSANYEWRFTREGEQQPWLIRYEADTEVTFNDYGTTQIVAQYGGQEAVCIVRCKSE